MKILKSHIFSFFALLLCAATVFSWWRSTRVWEGHYFETPYGILSLQTESSLFVVGVEFMQHDHRWFAWSNADPIWNDSMRMIWKPPLITSNYGKNTVMMPYWQLAAFFALLAVSLFCYEFRRRRKITALPASPSPVPESD